jgi:chaperonin GroEL
VGKLIEYSNEARQRVLSGVTKLAKTVAVTMGPSGRNVILGKYVGAPTITKDGVSVAREVVLSDPIEELGCQLVKEAAGRTADVAGDGTTTATVLSHEIFSRGLSLVDKGFSPLDFRIGMEWALDRILKNLDEIAKPVDDFETLNNIAIISANNDPALGGKIAEAYQLAGRTGLVTAEASPGVENSVREVEGIELKSGYITAGFLEPGKSKFVMNNCHILICDRDITHITDNEGLFHELSNQNKNLLIICKDLKKEALRIFLGNNARGRIRVCAVKIPTFGKRNDEWLEDLSSLLDTVIVGEERGMPLSDVAVDTLGFASRVEVGKHHTNITGPKRNEARIQDRMDNYKKDLQKLVGDFELKDIRDRMAFLSSRASVLTIGYSTELELREKGDRVDDAMSAVRAAIEEGYVPGGGFALLRAASSVDLSKLDRRYHPAAKILLDSCWRPAAQIIRNASEDPDQILSTVALNSNISFGYNTAIGEYGDLIDMGVLDPKKVTRTALQNAVSIAMLLITTDAVIAENPDEPDGWQPPAGWRQKSQTNHNHNH